MMEFNEYNQSAKKVALHYAKKLNSKYAEDVLKGERDINCKEDAKLLTQFFWSMSDEAAEDHLNDVEVEGGVDLEFWLEKLMNIFIGYMNKMGFNQCWVDESNRINHSQ